jgi:hypothetical protein
VPTQYPQLEFSTLIWLFNRETKEAIEGFARESSELAQTLPLLFWSKCSLKLGPEKHNTYFTLQSWYAQTGLQINPCGFENTVIFFFCYSIVSLVAQQQSNK